MKLIAPLALALAGLGAGVAAGVALKPAPPEAPAAACAADAPELGAPTPVAHEPAAPAPIMAMRALCLGMPFSLRALMTPATVTAAVPC